MIPPRARVAASVVALLVVAGLAGCGGPPPPTDVTSDVDRERAAFLSADPILEQALSTPRVTPGLVHNEKLGWVRTEVTAQIFKTAGGSPTPESVEQEVARAAATLRRGGWLIHWEMCLPPPEINFMGMVEEDPIPIPVARAPGYEWLASGYKINNGVSYWVLLLGALGDDGEAVLEVLFRAPNARDAANLFDPEPVAVPVEQACAEDGRIGKDIEKAGTPTVMRDWWPFPAETRTRDPNQV